MWKGYRDSQGNYHRGIYTGNDDPLYTFVYHATIGGAIAQYMQKYTKGEKYDKYDMIFGFWTSYWISYAGLDMKLYDETPIKDREFENATMVDFANVMKAMCYKETEIGYGGPNMYAGPHYGLMQCTNNCPSDLIFLSEKCGKSVELSFFNIMKGNEKTTTGSNPFNEIGLGVSRYMFKLIKRGDFSYQGSGDRTPTVYELIDGTGYYNGKESTDPYPTGYEDDIRNLLFFGIYPHSH
jgi:hypothetical protein